METNSVSKKICMVYNTFLEMKSDPDVRAGMVVLTLGHDTINDSKGGLYKISTKSAVGLQNIGEPFDKDSSLYAIKINLQLNS